MSDYAVGQRLGDYEILGILGAGGMGQVYKVRNTISDRVEAMKILLPDLAHQKDLADRFLREIKVLASLNHPNIAALRTALTLDNQLVMIMEFVDGVTLSSRLHDGAIPPVQAVKYIDQVLDALSYAHKQGVIHRDIKPANMMLMADGTVKLMDFGIARSASDRSLTMTGTTLGSLNYMPPEQVKGEPADNRSDLYSLGVSLYEMVTGELPFKADSNYAIMAAHLQEEPRPPIVLRPGIPQPLNQIVLMALAKDPAQRFQSADAFRGALKSIGAQSSGTQPDVSPRSYAPSAAVGSATALFQETPVSGSSPTTFLEPPAQPPKPLPPTREATQPFAAATPTPAAAAAQPAAPPPVASSSGHRGLYIALGAFIVVAVLFAAGLYLPGHLKIFADKAASQAKQPRPADTSTGALPVSGGTPAPADSTGGAPQTPPPTGPLAAAPQGDTGAAQAAPTGTAGSDSSATPPSPSTDTSSTATATAQPKKGGKGKRTASSDGSVQQAGSQATNGQPTSVDQVPAEDKALIQENEQRYDDIDSRATAVSTSLDTLKSQQAAAGYGLRGDIVSAEARMKTDIAKAQAATQNKDAKSAKKYLDMAEAELKTLETFLGH